MCSRGVQRLVVKFIVISLMCVAVHCNRHATSRYVSQRAAAQRVEQLLLDVHKRDAVVAMRVAGRHST
jgi:hypothetical protein